MVISFQFGGTGNVQITQQNSKSFSKLLNDAVALIKARQFTSNEVKQHFETFLEAISVSFNDNKVQVFTSTKHIKFPFQAIPEDEILNNQNFFLSFIDALAVLAFSDCTFSIRDHRLNIKINDKQFCGIYFQDGIYTLVENYIMLLREMGEKKENLPADFVCIILQSRDSLNSLDEAKIKNVVTDIMGNYSYIKPLSDGKPKCVSLTSYIINEAGSVADAKNHIKGVISFD